MSTDQFDSIRSSQSSPLNSILIRFKQFLSSQSSQSNHHHNPQPPLCTPSSTARPLTRRIPERKNQRHFPPATRTLSRHLDHTCFYDPCPAAGPNSIVVSPLPALPCCRAIHGSGILALCCYMSLWLCSYSLLVGPLSRANHRIRDGASESSRRC